MSILGEKKEISRCKTTDGTKKQSAGDGNLFLKMANIIDEYVDHIEKGKWIPCEERMPEEHDSCLAKWYGTNRWDSETMWRKQSDDVLVTMEFEDGSRKTKVMKTHDGKWFYNIYVVKFKAIAWQPLPKPYREVQDETD